MTITILSENCAAGRGIAAEHGLSCWLEHAGFRLLFDTGQGMALTNNAATLGLDLATLDAVVLSHGHYDHTGGLGGVVAQLPAAPARPLPLYAHPGVIRERYRIREDGSSSMVGMPPEVADLLTDPRLQLSFAVGPQEVAPGIMTTGEVPRRHAEEQQQELFAFDAAGTQPDLIPDDQAVVITTPAGSVVLLGCTHAGVINTLDYVLELTAGAPLRLVVGGLHLRSATPEQLEWTVRQLQRFAIGRLIPLHCTGYEATARLRAALPDSFGTATAGTVLKCPS